jgi:hypothetical protein
LYVRVSWFTFLVPNSSGTGASVAFKDITGLPTAFEVLPGTDTYGANISQWAETATASSQYSTAIYEANNLVGALCCVKF